MRSLAETNSRWQETLKHSASFGDLQQAVKYNGSDSPCISGCRSVCWKAFLLFQDASAHSWSHVLLELRNTYSSLQGHFLKYIKHPEQLAALTLDPLADEPDSPWITSRQDDAVRAEILQDVRRLPDDPFYHQDRIQTMILDILFIYCKLNPDVGGYRQGMHELLAPIVYAVDQDAIDRDMAAADPSPDPIMVEMLDSFYVEHDAFALFTKVMDKAKSFYETNERKVGSSSMMNEQNTIVEKSKIIHELFLQKVDPELSSHLSSSEILPQIFLIRWIRLLFSREFPFEELLVLWDTIFAVDPSLELIDLICVAMLIRIRWSLVEADYSVALQLLLKYPSPQAPHGPHTFVDDAIYLRDHLDSAGGSALITKYTGRPPSTPPSASSSRPATPSFPVFNLRPRSFGTRSPLSPPAKFRQQQGGMEALFQGAAKGVIERGEKLGINQAVRDAMGEIRRNMQGLQESRGSLRPPGNLFADPSPASAHRTVPMMDRRNKQLAGMLEETVQSLRALATSGLGVLKEEDKDKVVQVIEVAAAKVQFVQVHLDDSSMDLPDDAPPPSANTVISTPKLPDPPTPDPAAMDTTEAITKDMDAVAITGDAQDAPSQGAAGPDPTAGQPLEPIPPPPAAADRMDTGAADAPDMPDMPAAPAPAPVPVRPGGPIPTRSTLAQSSFAWMLEPDTAPSSGGALQPPMRHHHHHHANHHAKRSSASLSKDASRGRNAFLFGEVVPEGAVGGGGGGGGGRGAGDKGTRQVRTDEIFGLEPIRKGKVAD